MTDGMAAAGGLTVDEEIAALSVLERRVRARRDALKAERRVELLAAYHESRSTRAALVARGRRVGEFLVPLSAPAPVFVPVMWPVRLDTKSWSGSEPTSVNAAA